MHIAALLLNQNVYFIVSVQFKKRTGFLENKKTRCIIDEVSFGLLSLFSSLIYSPSYGEILKTAKGRRKSAIGMKSRGRSSRAAIIAYRLTDKTVRRCSLCLS